MAGGRAWAHRAPDFFFGGKRPVEEPQAPEDAAVGARVAAVEGVAVVEVERQTQGVLGRAPPAQERLAPGHAHVVVQLAVDQERLLGRVPQRVAGLAPGQPLPRVDGLALVLRVALEGLAGPGRQRLEAPRIVVVEAEIVRQIKSSSRNLRPPSPPASAASRAMRKGETWPWWRYGDRRLTPSAAASFRCRA